MSVRLNIHLSANRSVMNAERKRKSTMKIERGKLVPLLMVPWTSGSILNDVN